MCCLIPTGSAFEGGEVEVYRTVRHVDYPRDPTNDKITAAIHPQLQVQCRQPKDQHPKSKKVCSHATAFTQWAGSGFQAAPGRRPRVPDLLRGDAEAPGRRIPPVLHKRMCLLREENCLPFGQEGQSDLAATEGAGGVTVAIRRAA